MFDPNIPVANSPNSSAQMRAQLQSIVDLISSIPQGAPGQNGSDGTSVTGAVIDNTTTLDPGNAAEAGVSWDGSNVRFTFGIPRGQDGFSAPPITSFIVDGVTTLNPGEPATANASFDGSSVRITFGIPRGADGTDGPQGLPGEVSSAQLSGAIGGTSSNTNGVATLDTPFANDPPTLADLELMRAKMNELITALRR